MKKRPLGVIVSAIVLGLMAAIQFAVAGILLVAAIVDMQSQIRTRTPLFSLADSLTVWTFAMCVLFALLSGCFVLTLVGLLRLQNWARWSILVIAGGSLTLSLGSVFGIWLRFRLTPAPVQAGVLLQPTPVWLLVSSSLFYVMLGVLAGWWLVYFSLRSTRGYFLPGYRGLTFNEAGHGGAEEATADLFATLRDDNNKE